MLDWIKNNVKKFIAIIVSIFIVSAGATNPEIITDVIDAVLPSNDLQITWTLTKDGIIDKEYLVTIFNPDDKKICCPIVELFLTNTSFDANLLDGISVERQIQDSYKTDVPVYDVRTVNESYVDNATGIYIEQFRDEIYIIKYEKQTINTTTWEKWSPKTKNIKIDGQKIEMGVLSVNPLETLTLKVTFKTPITQDIDGYGSKGKVGFLVDGKEYHPWWNSSWTYKVSSVVEDVNFPYPMKLNVSYKSGINNATTVYCGGNNNTNFTDIRFVLNDVTELAYWIKDNSTNNISVFVNVTSNGTVYMYYGNSGAITTMNGSATFDFFDDGIGNATQQMDLNKWEITKSAADNPTSLSTGGIMKVTPGAISQYISINKYVNCTMVTRAKIEKTVCRVGLMTGQNVEYGVTEGSTWYSGIYPNQTSTTIPGFNETVFNEYTIRWLNGTSMKLFINGTLAVSHSVGAKIIPKSNMGACYGGLTATGISYYDWVYIHKNVTSEPVWGNWGLPEEEIYITPIYAGWNLVAQLNQSSVNLQTLANYTDNVTHVRVWNATNQSFQIFTVGVGGNETALVHYGQAYWINLSSNSSFIQKDYSLSSAQSYRIGWNDIGATTNHSISEINTSLGVNVTAISFWNATTQKYQSFKSGYGINENVSVNVSYGFRAYMLTNYTWSRTF